MLRLFVICGFYFVFTKAMTTEGTTKAHHHHTNEPVEKDTLKFQYEPRTQTMVLINDEVCNIFNLTADESVAVHTDTGITAIELKLMALLTTGTKTSVTPDQLDKHIVHACGNQATVFYSCE